MTDYSGYRRSLIYWLEIHGLEYRAPGLIAAATGESPVYTSDHNHRFSAWLRESLIWTIDELTAGRTNYAFRGLLQVVEYGVRAGHDSTTHDAMATLRADLDDALRGAEKAQHELELVLQDAREERNDLPNFMFVDGNTDTGVALVIQARNEREAGAYAEAWGREHFGDAWGSGRCFVRPTGRPRPGVWAARAIWE